MHTCGPHLNLKFINVIRTPLQKHFLLFGRCCSTHWKQSSFYTLILSFEKGFLPPHWVNIQISIALFYSHSPHFLVGPYLPCCRGSILCQRRNAGWRLWGAGGQPPCHRLPECLLLYVAVPPVPVPVGNARRAQGHL